MEINKAAIVRIQNIVVFLPSNTLSIKIKDTMIPVPDWARMLMRAASSTAAALLAAFCGLNTMMQAALAQAKNAAELGATKMPGVRAARPGAISPNTGGM